MLFVAIGHPDLLREIPEGVDGVELRLDLFPEIDFDLLKSVAKKYPVMLTPGNLPEQVIEKLLKHGPPYFDLKCDLPEGFLQKMVEKYPKTKFFLSYHNYEVTPVDLEAIYAKMARIPAFSYKIAAMAQSSCDALRMLLFARKHPKVSSISMGEKGEFARVLGKVYGNVINFACLNDAVKTAPGQLSVQDLTKIYRYHKLNRETEVYGVIGDPVDKSRGHFHHNGVFEERNRNAVYVKMIVKPDELGTFFTLAKELEFRGLSVTMPLKEHVLPFLDSIDPKAELIGAVNTLKFENRKIFGTNTDSTGALDAIEARSKVAGKQIVILGAGGVARAIAFEAHLRGANVLILNRTPERAAELAKAVGCQAGSLSDLPPFYDILINCSPEFVNIPINPSALAMDVVYVPRETPFLKKAKEVGCQVIYGEEMFWNQAAAQTKLWIS